MRPLGWAILVLGALTVAVAVLVTALTGPTTDPERSGLIIWLITLGVAGTAALTALANWVQGRGRR